MQPSRPQQTKLGVLIISASVLAMAFADAVVKLLSSDLTVWQIFVARSLVAIPVLAGLMRFTKLKFGVIAPGWVFTRTLLLVLTWLFFYASLPVLSLSVAATAVYTNPIMTALLSALIIGETVNRRQWFGVLLGFAGVVAVLKPGTEAFSWATLLPLIAAALYAISMVITRSKCQEETPLVLAMALHIGFVVTGVIATGFLIAIDLEAGVRSGQPFLLGDWAAMGLKEWGVMALLGVLSAAYFVGVARAYQIAAPSIIATFDYGYLVSAALWGFIFFAERPDLLTICGMVLIALAGLLVATPHGPDKSQPRGQSSTPNRQTS